MRVILNNNDQRKLIETAKKKNKFTWKKLATTVGVKEQTIRVDWRIGKLSLPLQAFRELEKISSLQIQIKEIKEDNWGMRKGGKTTAKKRKSEKINPKKSVELAELIGIILGDGNLFENKKFGVYHLRIFFNSKNEKEYAVYVNKLIKKVFNKSATQRKFKDKNCIFLDLASKAVIDYFKREGFQPGNKCNTQITIPKWIKKNKKFLKVCVRGLVDTDGSIYKLTPHWPNLTQIEFRNSNSRLLKDYRKALLMLGFNPSKIYGNKVSLTRQKEIEKYFKEITSKNKRYSPVV